MSRPVPRPLVNPEVCVNLWAYADEAGYINGAEIDISGGGHLNTLVLGSRRAIVGP